MYVIGGHRLELQSEFINSIERCHITALQSSFDLINVNYNQMDIRLQTILSFPAPEDNGILIVGQNDKGVN